MTDTTVSNEVFQALKDKAVYAACFAGQWAFMLG